MKRVASEAGSIHAFMRPAYMSAMTLCKKEKSFQVGPGQRRSDPTFCPLICKISDLDSQIPSPFRSAPVG